MLLGRPAAEYVGLRNGTLRNGSGLALTQPAGRGNRLGTQISLPEGAGTAIDLLVSFRLPTTMNHTVVFTVQVLAEPLGTSASPPPPSGMGTPGIAVSVSPPSPNGTRTALVSRIADTGASVNAGTGSTGPEPCFPILATETTLDVRVLVDRSIAEFFVQGGRVAMTQRGYPRQGDAAVILSASFAGAVVDRFAVYDMGCGWE